MRFIKSVTDVERANLDELYRIHPKHGVRRRAHAILSSLGGFGVNDISRSFSVDRNTVCNWLQLWESQGIPGLLQRHRPGRPCILVPIDEKRLGELIKEEPRQIKVASAKLASETGKVFSLRTLTRTLKKTEFNV